MGDVQLEILQTIIAERFGINATFSKGSIIYKETIADTVEGIGHFEPLRHYAEVHLLLKPAERDSGLVFKTKCKEDILDKNWQRLILTHLYEKTHIGVLTGSPITDMEITLVSGRLLTELCGRGFAVRTACCWSLFTSFRWKYQTKMWAGLYRIFSE